MIRNGSNPIVQVVKRLGEIQLNSSLRSDKANKCFKVNDKDNFFLSMEGDVCEIKKETDELNFPKSFNNLNDWIASVTNHSSC